MILVCGEALIDLFPGATERSGITARAIAGGSPFNVAIGLARLGQKAAFLGGLSTDPFGRYLSGILEMEGVSTGYIKTSSALTTLSVVATDAEGHPAYAFHGEGAADRSLDIDSLPSHLPDTVTTLTFGSYSLAVEPVGSALLHLAKRESGRRVISLDPNVRPTVTPDMAAWRARFDEFLACATIVKASDEDIRTAYGAASEIDAVASAWLARGPALVVVTCGADGARAYHASGVVRAAGKNVTVADTVGAGDSFHAALLARLARRDMLTISGIRSLSRSDITDLLAYGVTAAALTCMRAGADLPTHDEMARANA